MPEFKELLSALDCWKESGREPPECSAELHSEDEREDIRESVALSSILSRDFDAPFA